MPQNGNLSCLPMSPRCASARCSTRRRTKAVFIPIYLRNTNVQWLRFKLDDDVKEMRFEDDEIEEFSLLPGDLLVCEGGEPGRCAIWDGRTSPMMFQNALHRVRPGRTLDATFLQYRLLS